MKILEIYAYLKKHPEITDWLQFIRDNWYPVKWWE